MFVFFQTRLTNSLFWQKSAADWDSDLRKVLLTWCFKKLTFFFQSFVMCQTIPNKNRILISMRKNLPWQVARYKKRKHLCRFLKWVLSLLSTKQWEVVIQMLQCFVRDFMSENKTNIINLQQTFTVPSIK